MAASRTLFIGSAVLESWIELVTEWTSEASSIFFLDKLSLALKKLWWEKKKKHIKVVIVNEECPCGLTKAYFFLYKE